MGVVPPRPPEEVAVTSLWSGGMAGAQAGMTFKIQRCFASLGQGQEGWAGPETSTQSQAALGLSPCPSDRAELGVTCLGSWESDGAFDAWVALRKNSEP